MIFLYRLTYAQPVMSVPECARYRNSTMFVGTPPFGYECTDDNGPDTCHRWEPPRTPPCGMTYREIQHPVAAASPHVDSGSRLQPKSQLPDWDVPEMKLTDVVPALYSSPRIGPQLIQDVGENSITCRSGLQDVRYASESHNRPSGEVKPVEQGWLVDCDHGMSNWLTCKTQGMRWGTMLSPCLIFWIWRQITSATSTVAQQHQKSLRN